MILENYLSCIQTEGEKLDKIKRLAKKHGISLSAIIAAGIGTSTLYKIAKVKAKNKKQKKELNLKKSENVDKIKKIEARKKEEKRRKEENRKLWKTHPKRV
jgi:predicted transcriptional regulator